MITDPDEADDEFWERVQKYMATHPTSPDEDDAPEPEPVI